MNQERKSLIIAVSMFLALIFYQGVWTALMMDLFNYHFTISVKFFRFLYSITFNAALYVTAYVVLTGIGFLKRKVSAVFALMLVCSVIMRVADYEMLYYSGVHINEDFWMHAFYKESLTFLFNIQSGLIILATFFAGVGFYKLLIRFNEELDSADRKYIVSTVLILSSVLYLFFFSVSKSWRNTFVISDKKYYVPPERYFIVSLFNYVRTPVVEKVVLSDAVIEKFKNGTGIYIDQNSPYPLMRNSIYLDKKTRDQNIPVMKPNTNIIIVLSESLSYYFIDTDKHHITNLTPNINDFKKKALSFTNMYNVNGPTIRGLFALMSSFPVPDKYKNFNSSDSNLFLYNFFFLTDILRSRGYDVMHVRGSNGDFASTKPILTRFGTNIFYSQEDDEVKKYASRGMKRWGLTDYDLFKFFVDKLKGYENSTKPFIASIMTTDLHIPYESCKDTIPEANGNGLLNCVHSTDVAFGELWDFFKNSKLKENTILIYIGDHAIMPNKDYMNFRPGYGSKFDKITALFYIPGANLEGKENGTFSCQLDFTPTLLDLMGIDVPNPYLGLSIFADRKNYPSFYTMDVEMMNNKGFDTAEVELLHDYINYLFVSNMICPDTKTMKK